MTRVQITNSTLTLRARAIVLSLKNLLVLINTKLHSKSYCYLYLVLPCFHLNSLVIWVSWRSYNDPYSAAFSVEVLFSLTVFFSLDFLEQRSRDHREQS